MYNIEFLYGIWIRRNLDFVEQCESSGIKLKKSSEYYKAKMSRFKGLYELED